jgi:putative ABC transport system substrate-binding protein
LACRALGLSVQAFDARSLDELPRAFAAMVEWQANGVITLNDAFFFSQRERVVTLTINNKLAAVHPEGEFVDAGGLVSYGPNLGDLFRRAASYVDKSLKGQSRPKYQSNSRPGSSWSSISGRRRHSG